MKFKKYYAMAILTALTVSSFSGAIALASAAPSSVNASITTTNASKSTDVAPITMPTLSPLPQIGTGTESAFAIDSERNLWAWGKNDKNQLGLTVSDSKTSTPTKIAEGVMQVAGGKNHTLILTIDGELKSFGNNEHGQLGHLSRIASGAPSSVMEDVMLIAAGDSHSLALGIDGTLYAWGDNSKGQLGTSSSNSSEAKPVKVMTDVVEIAAGGNVSMALKSNGVLYVWGENSSGQVGNGKTANVNRPTAVLKNVVSFDTGGLHSLAATSDGNLYAWGRGNNGQLGNAKKTSFKSPTKIQSNMLTEDGSVASKTISKITKVSAGRTHSIILNEDNDAYIFGIYRFEQAQGSSNAIQKYLSSRPKRIAKNIANVSSGDGFSLLVKNDGNLYAYGMNSSGQLGQGRDNSSSPSNKLVAVKLGDSSSSNSSNSSNSTEGTTNMNHPIYGKVSVKEEKVTKTDKNGKSYELTETTYERALSDTENAFTVVETNYGSKDVMKALIPKDHVFIYTMDLMILSDGSTQGSSRAYYVNGTKLISTIRVNDVDMIKAIGTKVESGEDVHKVLG